MSAEDGHWTRFWDAEQDAHYFHHSSMDESVWDAPKGCAIWDENGILLQKADGGELDDGGPVARAESTERDVVAAFSSDGDAKVTPMRTSSSSSQRTTSSEGKRSLGDGGHPPTLNVARGDSNGGGDAGWEMAPDSQGARE